MGRVTTDRRRLSRPDVVGAKLCIGPRSRAPSRQPPAKQEMAVVVQDGRLVGVVTSTDAFETIAGELEDPLD